MRIRGMCNRMTDRTHTILLQVAMGLIIVALIGGVFMTVSSTPEPPISDLLEVDPSEITMMTVVIGRGSAGLTVAGCPASLERGPGIYQIVDPEMAKAMVVSQYVPIVFAKGAVEGEYRFAGWYELEEPSP